MKAEILKINNNGSLVIPTDYILNLGIRDRVLCIFDDDQIILRPFYDEIKEESKDLLEELRDEGLEGEELLLEYKRRKKLE